MTIADWIRQALRAARHDGLAAEARRKLHVIRESARSLYPTSDIEQMLGEIGAGYAIRDT